MVRLSTRAIKGSIVYVYGSHIAIKGRNFQTALDFIFSEKGKKYINMDKGFKLIFKTNIQKREVSK